ncbi:MAG: hypothetical protein RLN90_09690 [Balneolaceae bacterium]
MGIPRIDHKQAVQLLKLYTPKEVAKKLKCSTRQLRRINADHTAATSSSGSSPLLPEPDEELFLMQMYREQFGETFEELGTRFGLTKQAVQQRLSQ